MAGTMIPVVYGEPERKGTPGLLIAHTLGSLFGGLLCGAALGGLQSLFRPLLQQRVAIVDVALGLLALVLALRAARLAPVPIPESHWQVPRKWLLSMRPWLAAGVYGGCLGAVLFTRITTSMYLVMIWIVVRGDVKIGAVTMAIYALSRSAPLWVLYALCGHDGQKRETYVYAASQWDAAAALASSTFLVLAGGFFVMLHHA